MKQKEKAKYSPTCELNLRLLQKIKREAGPINHHKGKSLAAITTGESGMIGPVEMLVKCVKYDP